MSGLGTVAPWSEKKGPWLPYRVGTTRQPGNEFHRRRRGGDGGTLTRVEEKTVLAKVGKSRSKRTRGGGVERRVQSDQRRRRARSETARARRLPQRRRGRQIRRGSHRRASEGGRGVGSGSGPTDRVGWVRSNQVGGLTGVAH